MAAAKKAPPGQLAANRKARYDYTFSENLEAGISLVGTEVKSIRAGHVSLVGAFAKIENGEAWLHNLNITAYEHGNRFNHDPIRPRRLLLHRREIRRLAAETEQRGRVIVPLGLYLKKGRIKVDLGIGRGKTHGDKRETLRRKTADREADRAIRRAQS